MSTPTPASIRAWLDVLGVPYRRLAHGPTRTSEESARARGEPLENGAKALLLKTDDTFGLFVLSAALRLDSAAVRRETLARQVRFASRDELLTLTGLEPGSVPPFGHPVLPFDLFPLVNRLQASPLVDDAERAALGITVRDKSPTPIPAPSTSPIAIVSTATRLKHTLRIADETTPTRRAKPDGVTACQVWFKVGGAPPASESELTLLGIFTKSTIENAFVMDQGNEPVYYRVRWLNAKGEPGPWSEIVAATIAA